MGASNAKTLSEASRAVERELERLRDTNEAMANALRRDDERASPSVGGVVVVVSIAMRDRIRCKDIERFCRSTSRSTGGYSETSKMSSDAKPCSGGPPRVVMVEAMKAWSSGYCANAHVSLGRRARWMI